VNGTPLASSEYTLDATTGIITFNVAPPNGHTVKATYEFYKVVRFGEDQRDSTITSFEQFQWDQISLVEVIE